MDIRFLREQSFQNHSVYFSHKKYVKFFTNTSKVLPWKSIGLSEENIANIAISNSNFPPTLINYYPLPDIQFNKNCLINNDNVRSLDAVNLYICYRLDWWSRDLDTGFT